MNLVLQQLDEQLFGLGADLFHLRTYYNAQGQLVSVLDSATSQELVLVYDSNGRLERLDTKIHGGSAERQVYCSYDGSGRLSGVTTDLTPADNSHQ